MALVFSAGAGFAEEAEEPSEAEADATEVEETASETEAERKAKEDFKRLLIIPYPFYNDTIGVGLGAAAIAEGYVQPQMLTVGSALGSIEGTYMFFLMVRNYQAPLLKRMFIEPSFAFGEFKDIKTYTGDFGSNSAFPNEKPGSNSSDEDNFTENDGSDNWVEVTFKFLLPIGSGRDTIIPRTKLDNGMPVSGQPGGYHWNPLKSGRTYIELQPFWRKQDLSDGGETQETNGIEVALTYDNTDFRLNPSRGSYWRVFFDRDWGAFDSRRPWSVWGGEITKYFNLGESKRARQRVLAFNFWTVDTPTWDSTSIQDGVEVFNRPPTYRGANLGGLWRLRGFPATRFNDKSAIYYGLEYRHMLKWNPLENVTMKGKLDVDWFQVVALGELGRVSDTYNIDRLHTGMKWSAGAGLRVMVNHIVVRVDAAGSEEEVIAQLFIGHPWPR
jgi:hypothetical protein